MIPIAKPSINDKELQAIKQVLKSGILAQGQWVEEFENEFAKYIGTKHAVATSNGTTALHLALLALNIGKGDEVITTPFSFIATANAIAYVGAKPVFVDIDAETFNINPALIEKAITYKTKAILPVHLFGLPANMPEIGKIAKKHNLFVIEDAAQAHGATINGKKVGSFGNLACFSFYPTKNMTTGEGGMITTNNRLLAEKIKILRNQGMKKRYQYVALGYNYRMTNLAAAIGLEQLKKLEKLNAKRIANALFYNKALSQIKGVVTPINPKGYKHVYNQYTIKVSKRNKLLENLSAASIGTSIYYPQPLHKEKLYKNTRLKLQVVESVAKQVLSLPVHPNLTNQELMKISKTISNFYEKN